MESDHRYYSRRAAEEKNRAKYAITAEARDRHKELAGLFARKAGETAVKQRQFAD
jgi:hypothetical protein